MRGQCWHKLLCFSLVSVVRDLAFAGCLAACLALRLAGWLAGLLHLGDLAAELRVCHELLGGTLLESWELALSLAEQPCYKSLDDTVALLELLHKDDVWRLGLAAQLGLCAEAVGRVGAQARWRSAVGSVAPSREVDIPLCFSSARATPTDRENAPGHPEEKNSDRNRAR